LLYYHAHEDIVFASHLKPTYPVKFERLWTMVCKGCVFCLH